LFHVVEQYFNETYYILEIFSGILSLGYICWVCFEAAKKEEGNLEKKLLRFKKK
jgi:hypothetical protein